MARVECQRNRNMASSTNEPIAKTNINNFKAELLDHEIIHIIYNFNGISRYSFEKNTNDIIY